MEDNTNAERTGSSPEEGVAVKLTARAIEMVRNAMARESRGPEYGLRVGVAQGGCSGFSYTMSFDDELKTDDTVIEAGGIRVLVDASALPHLRGTTLDYVTGLHGSGFKFENPKAERTCGCGQSFSG